MAISKNSLLSHALAKPLRGFAVAAIGSGLVAGLTACSISKSAETAETNISSSDDRPIVTSTSGTLQGLSDGSVQVFRGIPYAMAPTGPRRWSPPEPPQPWSGVKDASQSGPACPQPASRTGGIYSWELGEVSEDCLSLNVWAPEDAENAPVFVWIHGGSLVTGAGDLPMYDGTRIANETGVIVVTINYRLGVLGYLAHPELSADSPQNISGNYGLMDQIAALKWVEDNIAAFGGNPDNVTVAGESAGALSVVALMASPEASGLFDKAVAQSAYMVSMSHLSEEVAGHPSAESQGQALMDRAFGVSSAQEMREIPVEDIIAKTSWAGFPFPNIDGHYLTDQFVDVFDRGEQAPVPVLAGFNDGEIRSLRFLLPPVPDSASAYETAIQTNYAELSEDFLDYYPSDDLEESLLAITRDAMYGWTAERLAVSQSAIGQDSYFYLFDHGYPAVDEAGLHAFHAMEIPYMFGNLSKAEPPWPQAPETELESNLSTTMMEYWTSFAATGTPTAAGAPDWPSYEPSESLMIFSDMAEPAEGLTRDRYALHEDVVCRRRKDGTLQWNWNVGIIAPPLPPRVDPCQ